MPKPILISISPNLKKDDFKLALSSLFKPYSWQQGSSSKKLSAKLTEKTNQKQAWLFNAGRTALETGLKSLDLKSSDEVLCQAFTCVAVPNAIKWAQAKPVFVDTLKNGFNLSLKDLKKKITKNSKALIVQHTFGMPDNLEKIKKICKKNSLFLIEDCAHSLGVKYQGQPVGSFGDLTILSFGRDKIISSVFGGALLTGNQKLAKKINRIYLKLNYPSNFWTFKQLLHPIITYLIKPVYFSIGKYLMFIYQKSGLLSFPVLNLEKKSKQAIKPKKLPNVLAKLALNQLNKLEKLNHQRQKIANHYFQQFQEPTLEFLPVLRYPLLVNNPVRLIQKAKKHHILLGDWYRPVIAPKGVDLIQVGYQPGSCPKAEKVSQKVVNLPTLINQTEAKFIIQLIKQDART